MVLRFFHTTHRMTSHGIHKIGPGASKTLVPCQANPEELSGILIRDISSLNIKQYKR